VPILAKEEYLLKDKCGNKFKPLLFSKDGAFFLSYQIIFTESRIAPFELIISRGKSLMNLLEL